MLNKESWSEKVRNSCRCTRQLLSRMLNFHWTENSGRKVRANIISFVKKLRCQLFTFTCDFQGSTNSKFSRREKLESELFLVVIIYADREDGRLIVFLRSARVFATIPFLCLTTCE